MADKMKIINLIKLLSELLEEEDSVTRYIEYYSLSEGDLRMRMPFTFLYNLYVELCKATELSHVSKHQFSTSLFKAGFKRFANGTYRGFLVNPLKLPKCELPGWQG